MSFSVTLDPAHAVTALSFATAYVVGVGPNNKAESLRVTSLAVNGASTYVCSVPGDDCSGPLQEIPLQVTLGTVTTTVSAPAAVPEPATLTLLGIGLVGVGGRRWRERRMPS